MPSFDVVSEVDLQELRNAVDQTRREVTTRFDFKGTHAGIDAAGAEVTLTGDNDFQIGQVKDIFHKKLAKRGIDLRALKEGPVETTSGRARQGATVQQGIDQNYAKQLIKKIKNSKMKVQANIQGDQIRVTGKKRDDLQEIITLLKSDDSAQPLQFVNFRD